MERNGVKRNNEGERNPNEGVMERNGVKRNNEGERTRVKKSGATEGRATIFSRGINIPRAIFQCKLELIHRVQLVHVANDVFHFAFAMDFSRDVLERIHDLRIHPLVHIFDDFIVMVVMRVHIQGLLGL
jgi:hypothetical protein